MARSRRRLSSGSTLASSPEEVTEMYRTVIKLASENKITAKNAWSLGLIDHMAESWADDTAIVNFQSASCSLEAGVKIYCARLDDTWETSYRVLERLHRRARNDEPVEDDATDDEPRAIKQRASSRQVSLLVDDASINAPDDDSDPGASLVLWARRGLDGGSTRDMLLQRLPSVAATVSYEDTDVADDGAGTIVDERFVPASLPPDVCPELARLRSEAGDDDALDAALPETFYPPPPDEPPDSESPPDDPVTPSDDDHPLVDVAVFDDNNDNATPPDYVAPDFADEDYGAPPADDDDGDPPQQRLVFADVDDDLAFLDAVRSFGRNGWAGFGHWKTPGPPKKAPPTKKTAAAPKIKQVRVFDGPPPSIALLAPDKKKKQRKARPLEAADLALPEDLGVTLLDLQKLFLVDAAPLLAARDVPRFQFQDNGDDFGPPPEDDFFDPPCDQSSDDRPDLLSATRHVEHLDINYATNAKRVDVRALKASLWTAIKAAPKGLALSHLVAQVTPQCGPDLSLPFYFIGLLHLANEHTLRLAPDAGLADLTIVRGDYPRDPTS